MIERVYIETEAAVSEVEEALQGHGITVSVPPGGGDGDVQGYPHKFAADVPDSRDAEEEVTEALNVAGIEAYVYT